MVDALKARGYSADLQYANYDVPTQVNQVENMLAKGVKALVIAPIDAKTFSDALALAQKKGIKVISYDRLISQTRDVDYYATFDNFGVGVLQAQSIVSAWRKAGSKTPFNIEVFGGSSDDNNAHMVDAGGMSVLKPYVDSGKFVIRSKQVAFEKVATRNWDGATAQARMDNLLSAFYGKDHLDAVWAPNDALPIGIISSLKGVGYGSGQQAMPIITGQDADVQNLKNIVRGDKTSTVFKDTRRLAGVADDMVDDALPHALAYSSPVAEEAMGRIARALNVESAPEGLYRLNEGLGVPQGLRDWTGRGRPRLCVRSGPVEPVLEPAADRRSAASSTVAAPRKAPDPLRNCQAIHFAMAFEGDDFGNGTFDRCRCVTFVSHFDAHSRGGSGRRRSTFSRCSMGAATACRILSLAAR